MNVLGNHIIKIFIFLVEICPHIQPAVNMLRLLGVF